MVRDAKAASAASLRHPVVLLPVPKEPGEWNKHPKQVSSSGQDELREPWEEPGLRRTDDDQI